MPPTIRPATMADAAEMAELVNEIIAIGGTTAMTQPETDADIRSWMQVGAPHCSWHVAEGADGRLMGFQVAFRNPGVTLPAEALDIGTYVRVGATQQGIGSALFAATSRAARALEAGWINATIRADNAGGLVYYSRQGFETYREVPGWAMPDGRVVGQIWKRFTL